MKKVGIILCIIVFTTLLMTSCKSTEICPAYAQNVEVDKTQNV